MKTKREREIAEQIFDLFRVNKCRENQGIMFRSIRFGILDKLNPKEKDLAIIVLDGLLAMGYIEFKDESQDFIRITKKGYDYIYDDKLISEISKKPWIIPTHNAADWDVAYNKLWRIIGPQDTALHYISGPKFLKYISDLTDKVTPSYSSYIEERKNKDLSQSRVNYYNDLIKSLSDEEKYALYVHIQMDIENVEYNTTCAVDSDILDRIDIFSISDNMDSVKSEIEEAPLKVFISYSWDSEEHKQWVLNLAESLCKKGIYAILDRWDLDKLGRMLPNFMENSIANADRVICIMTPNYKLKTEHLKGGVGYEYSIISAEVFRDVATEKFIPLLRIGEDRESIPTILNGRMYIDMRSDEKFDEVLDVLLRDLYNKPKIVRPTIGKRPNFD